MEASKAQGRCDEAQREAHRVRELEAAQKAGRGPNDSAPGRKTAGGRATWCRTATCGGAQGISGECGPRAGFAARGHWVRVPGESERRLASDAANLNFVLELSGTSVNNLDVDPERASCSRCRQ